MFLRKGHNVIYQMDTYDTDLVLLSPNPVIMAPWGLKPIISKCKIAKVYISAEHTQKYER